MSAEIDILTGKLFSFKGITLLKEKLTELKDFVLGIQTNIDTINTKVNSIVGLGGALHYKDFGTDTPTQADLTQYACEQIWGEGGTFFWEINNHYNSVYNDADGVSHSVSENPGIFNGTHVTNSNDGYEWALTNTPNTNPQIFGWENIGVANTDLGDIAAVLDNINGENI